MTKADLIAMSLMEPRNEQERQFIEGLKELLETHAIIPKGANRVSDADVWHEIVEGAEFMSYNQTRDSFEDDCWIGGFSVKLKER